ncbi:MAG: phosphatase PAP2 family protein [Nocardiopsaceae bacterium]|nr:phosphatase PAP2 family protein [Nocardiopsaceae bacterium]
MEAIRDAEIDVILWIQSWRGLLEPPMDVVTDLGSQRVFLVLIPLLFWAVDTALGARLALLLMGSASLNGVVKLAFHGARPYWYSGAVAQLTGASTFGLPSAHAQNSLVVWGYLAARSTRRWAWPAAGTLITLIAFSRMVLGVHFLSDVLAGLAVGAVLLWLMLRYEAAVLRWWQSFSVATQIGAALGISLLPAAVAAGMRLVRGDWTAPEGWTGSVPPDPVYNSLAQMLGMGCGLFGIIAGASVLAARGWYSAAGPLLSRVARCGIGIIGLVLISVLLEAAFRVVDGAADTAVESGGYLLLALWAALGAPELFLRMGLAERPRAEESDSPVGG